MHKNKYTSDNLIFEQIVPNDTQIQVLFDLLNERDHQISHKGGVNFNNHREFVLNHPYRAWYIIRSSDKNLGSFYLNNDNHIGINIKKPDDEHLLSAIINFININWDPLEPIASVRGSEFAINAPPSNTLLISSLKKLGATQVQSTFFVPANFENLYSNRSTTKNKGNNKNNNFGNVLITSSAAKVSLIKSAKHAVSKINNKIKIFGGDITSNLVSKYFVDDFWKMPRIDEIEIDTFISECKTRKISLIIPTRDGELEFFARNKSYLLNEGIYTMISNLSSIERCIDKLKFSKQKDLSVIHSSEVIDDIQTSEYVVKERFGAGSASIGIKLSKDDAIHHSKKLTYPIFQPFVSGKEVSVDAYVEANKSVKGIVMRERVIVINGESQVTQTIDDSFLEDSFKKIIESMDLYGHIILQAIIDEDSKIHIIECNPRFGGASSISIKSGLDSFYWLYLESLGKDISNHAFVKSYNKLTQVRFQNDIYL